MNSEEVQYQATPHAKVIKWLGTYGVKKFKINSDGMVDVNGDVDLRRCEFYGTTLPIQFGTVQGIFDCSHSNMSSLYGTPHTVNSYFRCSSTNITCFEHAPRTIGGGCICYNTKIKSLSGINKMIKHIGGVFNTHDASMPCILGLLLIPGITQIIVDYGPIDIIMNKYVGTSDLLSAQDELIDSGFIEQAKL